MNYKRVKLETYIPETHLKDLQHALQEAGAGRIAYEEPVINVIPLLEV